MTVRRWRRDGARGCPRAWWRRRPTAFPAACPVLGMMMGERPSPLPESAMSQAPPFTNRLAHETSPYLRQHAHNPVDWYPWDEEALARARGLDRPIFLSVGYSACHWCHVMEYESFEDAEI